MLGLFIISIKVIAVPIIMCIIIGGISYALIVDAPK